MLLLSDSTAMKLADVLKIQQQFLNLQVYEEQANISIVISAVLSAHGRMICHFIYDKNTGFIKSFKSLINFHLGRFNNALKI
jgi:hypothetical protein